MTAAVELPGTRTGPADRLSVLDHEGSHQAGPHAAAVTAVTIDGEADLLRVRSTLRAEAQLAGLGLTATTKLVTAGSELARNILQYADRGHGVVTVQQIAAAARSGVRAQFTDYGPGIGNLEEVMLDGFSSGGSLGIGLPGSRRLVDEFDIESAAGRGTTVIITQWDQR